MKVYVSIISHFDGMLQDQETVRSFNVFMEQEVISRGFEITDDPTKADVMLMLPTYQYDKYCMDEYDKFKDTLIILTSVDQLEDCAKEFDIESL